jgi:hypothetical protein
LKSCNGVSDGHRVVERPKRVRQDPEPGCGQSPADFIGKTTAQHNDTVTIRNGHRRGIQGNGGLKLHHTAKIRKITGFSVVRQAQEPKKAGHFDKFGDRP